ncbi:MAG: chemotaxis protein CheW [Glaciimonas sp.]|nr:chemotaxis protein CheW [Glaciimonas sp.]
MNTASNLVKTANAPNIAGVEFLAFTLGQEEYGSDIQKVQELRGYDTVACMSNAPEFIKGVVNLRGIIVPIINMRINFNFDTPTCGQFTVVIILNSSEHVMGIVVNNLSNVITLAPQQIKSTPEMSAAPDTNYLIGLGAVEQRMLIFVDTDKLRFSGEMGLIENPAA